MIHPGDRQHASGGFLHRLRNAGIVLRLVVFTLAMGSAFVFAAAVAWSVSGHVGVVSAGLASFVCWGGSASSMVVHSAFRLDRFPQIAVGSGLLLRMTPPLAATLAGRYFREGLAEAGFLVYLIIFFELALSVQIGLLTPFKTSSPVQSGFLGEKDISQFSEYVRSQRTARRSPSQ